MSSIVLDRLIICAGLVLASTSVASKEVPPLLSCDTANMERANFRDAPKSVRRSQKHVLEIATQQGPRRFIDEPPHDDGDMRGVHWRYCGYSIAAKAHLIEKKEESTYSGDLLFDETGKVVHAGHTVLFAPDDKTFLAIEQEDGLDGENWTVYDADGHIKWNGYAGTTAKVGGIDTVLSTFDRPRWTRQGELTARFVCTASRKHGLVTLVRLPSGELRWRDHASCS